jgi:hypothetical protein
VFIEAFCGQAGLHISPFQQLKLNRLIIIEKLPDLLSVRDKQSILV